MKNFRRNKLSKNFLEHLKTKRKIKLIFGFYTTSFLKKLLNRSLRSKICSQRFSSEIEFCFLLERKIDFIFYYLKITSSVFEAKHLISHGKVFVNSRKNKNSSYLIEKGNYVSFDQAVSYGLKLRIKERIENLKFSFFNYPNLETNWKILKIIFLSEKCFFHRQLHFHTTKFNWQILMKSS